MRRGVISPGVISGLGRDFGRDNVADLERSGGDSNAVRTRKSGSQARHSLDGRRGEATGTENAADVRNLAARFEIEGGALEHHVSGLAGAQSLRGLPRLIEQSHDSDASHGRARLALELAGEL